MFERVWGYCEKMSQISDEELNETTIVQAIEEPEAAEVIRVFCDAPLFSMKPQMQIQNS